MNLTLIKSMYRLASLGAGSMVISYSSLNKPLLGQFLINLKDLNVHLFYRACTLVFYLRCVAVLSVSDEIIVINSVGV